MEGAPSVAGVGATSDRRLDGAPSVAGVSATSDRWLAPPSVHTARPEISETLAPRVSTQVVMPSAAVGRPGGGTAGSMHGSQARDGLPARSCQWAVDAWSVEGPRLQVSPVGESLLSSVGSTQGVICQGQLSSHAATVERAMWSHGNHSFLAGNKEALEAATSFLAGRRATVAAEETSAASPKPSSPGSVSGPMPDPLDTAQERRPLVDDEIRLRQLLKRRVLGLASLEHTIARQRARVAGLCDTDASAQFFHIYASKRNKRNNITTLRAGDRLVVDQVEKEQLATSYFLQLLGTAQPRDHDLDLGALGLPAVDLSALDAHFSEEEAWATIRAMPANRSPGPDGFTWDFFQCC
ncbi:hypothetical protein ACQ4PT_033198 [Festuca glaucescens]